MRTRELYIIAGVAGSGKATALKAFQDMGFVGIENLPAPLFTSFVDYLITTAPSENLRDLPDGTPAAPSITDQLAPYVPGKERGYALSVDYREEIAYPSIQKATQRLKERGMKVVLLFLDCQDEVLLRRFQETRRPHPLFVHGSLLANVATMSQALFLERERLKEFFLVADRIIDTSSYTPHELRRIVEELVNDNSNTLSLEIASFGFKYGVPRDVNLVFDVRFLPNPHFVPELRALTGEHKDVESYVFQSGEALEFVNHLMSMLKYLLPNYLKEGKRYLTIAIGCTGGRHRSVAIAQCVSAQLSDMGCKTVVTHRDKDRN